VTPFEGWILLEDSPRDPILQDPDRVWDEIRQRLAERRRYQLPPGRTLAAFRRSCGVSQATLAGRLGLEQSRISKLERRSDLQISALRAYVASLGGTLVLLARMPDRDVQLNL
jgi:DNA-binding XRE family transcriptional regulator